MTAFKVVYVSGADPFAVNVNDLDLLKLVVDSANAAFDAKADAAIALATEALDDITSASSSLLAGYAFPSVVAGATIFIDINGAQEFAAGDGGGGGDGSASDAGLTAYAFPAVEGGGIVYIDANGAQGDDPRFAELQASIAALAAGGIGAQGIPSAAGDILHILTDGQSLDGGTGGKPLLTTSVVPGGLRSSIGVRLLDSNSVDPAAWGTFAGLLETISTVSNVYGETPWSGFVLRINERLTAKFGTDLVGLQQSMLMTSAGIGGATVEQLSTGTNLARMLNAFDWAAGQAAAGGKAYNPLAMAWVQGHSNTTTAAEDYYNKVKALWAAAEARANTARGSARPLVFLTYSPDAWADNSAVPPLNAESFLWLQERNEYGIFTGPGYAYPHSDTIGHISAAGYKRLGAQMADALFDYIYEHKKRPVMRPTVERLGARELILRYPLREGARLVRDTSAADDFGDVLVQNGIRLVPADNVAYVDPVNNPVPPVSIAATVDFRGADMLLVRAASDIPTGGAYEVRQGWYDCKRRNATYIRDNTGDLLPTFDVGGVNAKLHNWAPVCRVSIP